MNPVMKPLNIALITALMLATGTHEAAAQKPPPVVEVSYFNFVEGEGIGPWESVSRVVNPGEPEVNYSFNPDAEVDKEAGCHPVTVMRRWASYMGDLWCHATECCHYEVRISPSGWPFLVLVCAITETHGCSSWPLLPPPPTPP